MFRLSKRGGCPLQRLRRLLPRPVPVASKGNAKNCTNWRNRMSKNGLYFEYTWEMMENDHMINHQSFFNLTQASLAMFDMPPVAYFQFVLGLQGLKG